MAERPFDAPPALPRPDIGRPTLGPVAPAPFLQGGEGRGEAVRRPKRIAVVVEASHACMTARGVYTPGVMMTASRMMGVFREDQRSRREVLALMGY